MDGEGNGEEREGGGQGGKVGNWLESDDMEIVIGELWEARDSDDMDARPGSWRERGGVGGVELNEKVDGYENIEKWNKMNGLK